MQLSLSKPDIKYTYKIPSFTLNTFWVHIRNNFHRTLCLHRILGLSCFFKEFLIEKNVSVLIFSVINVDFSLKAFRVFSSFQYGKGALRSVFAAVKKLELVSIIVNITVIILVVYS